ncbi:hypothetical protein PV11_03969 [Exophiala sideris]|uniref:Cytochrome b561 domain-containing protein n=1 Tax=Exophiala sideris TaxID=1016849 RepID=A0A0D1VZF1_9EURO|nr:hypothetical protein PV11_03969 [Exophiala sideris]
MKAFSLVATALCAMTVPVLGAMVESETSPDAQVDKRAFFDDSYKIFIRKRNAHACMMSIVFIVLFPLAAISLHLPLKGVRVVTRIHAPIQILGLAMMIGAMGLGIDIAKNDLNYFSPVKAHVVVGLLVTSTIIVIQPAMGILQHLHFKRTGKKSIFAYVHRWVGRVMICLGWINSGLGFQIVGTHLIPTHSWVRNFLLMGILGGIWFLLMGVDGFRSHMAKKDKLSSYRVVWDKGPRLRAPMQGQDHAMEPSKVETSSS